MIAENSSARLVHGIPVRNLWLLMLYASPLFREIESSKTVAVEANPDEIPDLAARLLCRRVECRIRRNLHYGYRTRKAEVNRVRGRINYLATERRGLLKRGKVACCFEELTTDNANKALAMMRLHIFTPTRLCVLFGEEMKKRSNGYILNMSSMAAKLPCPGITVYSATKAYLKSFSKSLYFEMRPYGVGVTTVCPAAIATPLYKLKPSLLKLGVKIGLIGTPQWLVRRALRGMFHKRRVVKPGLMNRYLPPLIAILPKKLVDRLWRKYK